jgi:hypothetical protein
MICYRFDLWNSLSRYVTGKLDAKTTQRLEGHLLDCNACRLRLSRLRDGQRFATQLPYEGLQSDAWEALEALIDAPPGSAKPLAKPKKSLTVWAGILTSPRFASAVLGIGMIIFGFAFFLNQQKIGAQQDSLAPAIDVSSFHPVAISNIQNNTAPHVVAEGYVTEVRLDHKDGDLLFKLVEDVSQSEPFIICEIISPINLAPPTVGSHVKVYGVSRYDDGEGRQWHEVHPVLALEKIHDDKP